MKNLVHMVKQCFAHILLKRNPHRFFVHRLRFSKQRRHIRGILPQNVFFTHQGTIDEAVSVGVILENRPPLDSTNDNVLQCSGGIYAGLARHDE